MTSENILKVKSQVKEGCDISDVKEERYFSRDLQKLSESVNEFLLYENFQLSEESKKVCDYVAGFIAHKYHHTVSAAVMITYVPKIMNLHQWNK